MAEKEGKRTFRYSARKKDTGEFVESTISASSEDAVKRFLTDNGYSIYEITQQSNRGLNREISFGFKKKVKARDLALMARRFSVMLDAGVTVTRSLDSLRNGKDAKPAMKAALDHVKAEVDNGRRMWEAMSELPDVFPPLMVAMIAAGEEQGDLDQAFRQIAVDLEARVKLQSKIKSALTYPVAILILAALMCVGMLLFIVPVFDNMFSSLGGKLPFATQLLVWASDALKVLIVPLAILIALAIVWWRKNKNKTWVRRIIDPIKLRIPVLKNLFLKLSIARFSRNLSSLLQSGVRIPEALNIVGDTVGNTVIKDALIEINKDVQQGQRITTSMSRFPVFPDMVTEMVNVGEVNGSIPVMLEKVADAYDEDVEATTESLTSLIEPLMIVFLGSVVGAMIVALYMPIFSIYELVK